MTSKMRIGQTYSRAPAQRIESGSSLGKSLGKRAPTTVNNSAQPRSAIRKHAPVAFSPAPTPKEIKRITCENCEEANELDAQFCKGCGEQFVPPAAKE